MNVVFALIIVVVVVLVVVVVVVAVLSIFGTMLVFRAVLFRSRVHHPCLTIEIDNYKEFARIKRNVRFFLSIFDSRQIKDT